MNNQLESSVHTLSKTALWLLAIRPKTLPAAVGPVAVGAAVAAAEDTFSPFPVIGCLLCATLLQIGVNLANDYFDGINKIDSEERLGPTRVTQSGLIPPGEVKLGMILTLALAAIIFIYLAIVGGWPIVVIGLASLLSALAYSGGPYPLASHGLGELFVFIFFGPVAVMGTYLIQAHELNWLAFVASLPPGLLITAIMVVNNLRDIDTDRKAGKHTLAVKMGRGKAIRFYQALLVASFIIPLAMLVSGFKTPILLPFLVLPIAISLCKKVQVKIGRELNGLLAETAILSLLFSVLLSAGLIWG